MNTSYTISVEWLKKFETQITNFHYPDSYLKVVELNLFDYDHWYLLSNELISSRYDVLKQTFPERHLVPFAARYDCDDIACFDVEYVDRVIIINDQDYADDGNLQVFETFWNWFISAIKELIGIYV